MSARPIARRIIIRQGDITQLRVDAIVNAANARLAGGGGVDGAIHRAAGPAQLHAACAQLGGCATGDAKPTPGFNLPARHIIHTVGPVYTDGTRNEPVLLASCYRRALEVARDLNCHSVAFPAISTGIYGYPFEAATAVALRTVADFLAAAATPAEVTLIFFSANDYDVAVDLHARLAPEP